MNRLSLFLTAITMMVLGASCGNLPKDLTKGLPGGLGDLIPSVGSSSSRSSVDSLVSGAKALQEGTKDIPEDEEIALGEQLMPVILGAAPLYDNERIQRYVNQVGRWIASKSERPNLPWRFAVLDSKVVNAGAAPGGQIYITTGLLFRMRSEAELAGALAHEIAHVVQRHQITAYQSKLRWGALSAGAGALADTKIKTGVGRQVAKIGLNEAKSMIVLSLGRDEELQADRMGMVLAARAGYDPFGLPATIQILQDMSAEQSGLSLVYSTHPSPTDRLAALDIAIAKSMEQYANQATAQDRFNANILGTTTSSAPPPTPAPAPPKKKP